MGVATDRKKNLGLLTHRTVARLCDLETETLRKWVARGKWPEPHSIVEQTWFYQTEVIHYYLDFAEWPEGTKFRTGVGRERPETASG